MIPTDDNATYRTRPSIKSGTRSSVRVAFVAPFRRVLGTTEEARVRRSSSHGGETRQTRGKRKRLRDSIESGKRKKRPRRRKTGARFSLEKSEAVTRGLGREEIYFLNYVDRINCVFDYICRAKEIRYYEGNVYSIEIASRVSDRFVLYGVPACPCRIVSSRRVSCLVQEESVCTQGGTRAMLPRIERSRAKTILLVARCSFPIIYRTYQD